MEPDRATVGYPLTLPRFERIALAQHLGREAERKLKAGDHKDALHDARASRSLARWTGSVDPARIDLSPAAREILVASSVTEALALGYADDIKRGLSAARVARQYAASAEAHPHLGIQAELAYLHISEMDRALPATMDRLWTLGAQLQRDDWSRKFSLRAYARFIACGIWAGDLDSSAAARREGDRVLLRVDDADARGSYLIWTGQLLMRQDRFEESDQHVDEALELRERTPRRDMTDLYAGAFLELRRDNLEAGRELANAFFEQTTAAGLFQYARVGLETLKHLLR